MSHRQERNVVKAQLYEKNRQQFFSVTELCLNSFYTLLKPQQGISNCVKGVHSLEISKIYPHAYSKAEVSNKLSLRAFMAYNYSSCVSWKNAINATLTEAAG